MWLKLLSFGSFNRGDGQFCIGNCRDGSSRSNHPSPTEVWKPRGRGRKRSTASSANWPAQNETIPVGNQHAKLLGQKSPISVSSPKAKRKQRTPIQRVSAGGHGITASGVRSHAGATSNPCTILLSFQRTLASQPTGSCWSRTSRSVKKRWKWPSRGDCPPITRSCSNSERCMNSTTRSGGCCLCGVMATTTPPIRR